jgi:hypothetical protein
MLPRAVPEPALLGLAGFCASAINFRTAWIATFPGQRNGLRQK